MIVRGRLARRLAGPALFALVVGSYYAATALEERRMAATSLQPAAAAAPHRVDPVRLFTDLTALAAPSLDGRRTGSAGSHLAQDFIVGRFREAKLKPIEPWPEYAQKFSFTHRSIIGTVVPGRQATTDYPDAHNLGAVVRGTALPDVYLLVSAHYDHLGIRDGKIYPGADDNASGVAAMLETARYVAAHPLRHSVMFVAFDGEEEGLQGSKYFVAHPPIDLKQIRLAINLDMVSRSDTSSIVASGTAFDPSLKDLVTKAAAGRSLTVAFGHDRPIYVAGGVEDWTQQSDQGPLHDAGVTTLYYGVEDHPDYHQPTDTVDKIPRAFYTEVVELVIQTVLEADSLP